MIKEICITHTTSLHNCSKERTCLLYTSCAVLLKPHKKEDGTTEDSTLKERMKVAYTAAHTTMINRYTEAIGKMLHPGITLTLTLIAILGMIFGLFSINPIVTAIFVVLSILALIGMSKMCIRDRVGMTFRCLAFGS